MASDKAQAAAGDIVTFTAVPSAGHYLKELKVQKCTSADEAEAAPLRPVDVASAESVTMTYDAATGSYSGKYTMPACDVAVVLADFAAKTSQSLVANDVTATLGETALAVTATNGTQDGGTLTYAVSEGSDVVSIDAETGALTVLKAGKATVTVTAAETERYLATTVSVKVTILGTIVAQADNVNVTYDGTAHGIAVKVSDPSAGYTIVYGTEAGQCTSATSPTQTTAGTLTVYYEVSADNYALLTGSATVTIAKADIATGGYTAPETVVVTGDGIAYSGGEQALVSGGTSADGTVHYRVNGGEWSEETPSATEPGTYIIDWYVEGDANHNDVGSETEPAGSLAVTILAQREVTMANGVATFYDGASAYNIPDNVRAWTGTVDYANGCVNMSEVTGGVIPAGTAVVLTSDETAITLVQSLSAAAAIESDLKGTDTYTGGALTGNENIYVLRNGEFVWANSGTLPSGKAYLVYDASQAQAAATRLWLNFGGEELGIAAIESLAEKQSLYNLQGQKVGQPRKGEIYIKGGRKAIIR
ncbi:MAG: hypothetical protein K6E73_10355 [Bacteroidales bacterium]|nr:hypothetical protein [Bacteroidales bacterium]